MFANSLGHCRSTLSHAVCDCHMFLQARVPSESYRAAPYGASGGSLNRIPQVSTVSGVTHYLTVYFQSPPA